MTSFNENRIDANTCEKYQGDDDGAHHKPKAYEEEGLSSLQT